MDEYQKQLFEEGREQSRTLDKGISASALAVCSLSLAVWKGVSGGIDPGSAWALWACWSLMGLAVVFVLVSHAASQRAISLALKDYESSLDTAVEPGGAFSDLVTVINRAALAAATLGVLAFIWFAWCNLGRLALP
jgi:hypothetical protein